MELEPPCNTILTYRHLRYFQIRVSDHHAGPFRARPAAGLILGKTVTGAIQNLSSIRLNVKKYVCESINLR